MSVHFFQKQGNRDCSLVSLNNASGREVLSKEELRTGLNKLVTDYAERSGLPLSDRRVSDFRNKLEYNHASFSPYAVWYVAYKLGRIPGIPSYTPATGLNAFGRYVILGRERYSGINHAVGCRSGKIYDSVTFDRPVDLTSKNMNAIFSEIFAMYAVDVLTPSV